MKRIITDSVKDVNRIIRRENYSGNPSYGVEAVTAINIAWQMLIESKSDSGITSIRLINTNTAAAVVLDLLIKNSALLPFVPRDCLCLATSREILNCLNSLRSNNPNSVADTHVDLLLSFQNEYESRLKEQNLFDNVMVLQEAVRLLDNGYPVDSENEYQLCYFAPPSELENEFVSKLSGMQAVPVLEKPKAKNSSYQFVRCFGVSNEADYIARTIVEKQIPLGNVSILCDTTQYKPYLDQVFAKRGLSLHFTSGVSAASFNQLQLYKQLIRWYLDGCKYRDLYPVCHNPLFAISVDGKQARASSTFLKGISYGIGWGMDRYFDVEQSSYDREHDPSGSKEAANFKSFRTVELPKLGKLAQALDHATSASEAYDSLYAYIHEHTFRQNLENKLLASTLLNLRRSLSAVQIIFSAKQDLYEYILGEIDSITYSQSDDSSAASVSGYSRPQCLERKYVFIPGLSAKEFHVSSAESPVLSDALKKALFGYPPRGNVRLAENAYAQAEQVIYDTLSMLPDETEVVFISSSADVLRDSSDVSSSALFEKLLEEHGGTIINEDRYYEITTHSVQNKRADAWSGYNSSWPKREAPFELSFSKSSLDTLLECPLKYHYDRDLGINQEEYPTYDPSSWLAANEVGTLVHRILELYANSALIENAAVSPVFDPNNKEFNEAFETALQEASERNAAPNATIRDAEALVCKEMTISYLTQLHGDLSANGWIVQGCEEALDPGIAFYDFTKGSIPFHLSFSGRIDRVDRRKSEDGSIEYRIVDYKTGKAHKAKDMATSTKQHLIYANYIQKKYGGTVSSFDYVFLKDMDSANWNASISSDFISNTPIISPTPNEEGVSEEDILYSVYGQNNYLINPPEKCTYCRYKDICLHSLR